MIVLGVDEGAGTSVGLGADADRSGAGVSADGVAGAVGCGGVTAVGAARGVGVGAAAGTTWTA